MPLYKSKRKKMQGAQRLVGKPEMYTGAQEHGPQLEATAGSLGSVCKSSPLNQHLLVHTILLQAQDVKEVRVFWVTPTKETLPQRWVANHHLRGKEGEAVATGAEKCPETSWGGEHQP